MSVTVANCYNSNTTTTTITTTLLPQTKDIPQYAILRKENEMKSIPFGQQWNESEMSPAAKRTIAATTQGDDMDDDNATDKVDLKTPNINFTVRFTCTPEERNRIYQRAKLLGMTVGNFLLAMHRLDDYPRLMNERAFENNLAANTQRDPGE